jgi:glycosyltransferase involved in cell wall biosynthesis
MSTSRGEERPLFSVVIPAFNARSTIRETVASALDPTVSMEILVVDDGSPDPVRPEDLPDGPIRLIRCERNGGTARARNRGILEARGIWIAFLDADDLYEPGRLGAADSFLESHPVDGLFTETLMVATDGSERVVAPRPDKKGVVGLRKQAPIFAALITRKATFDEIGLFDPRWHLLEDVDLCLRLLTSPARIEVMPRPAYVYREHDKSKTRAQDPVRVLREERNIHLWNALRLRLTVEQRAVLLVRAWRWQVWEIRHYWDRLAESGRSGA